MRSVGAVACSEAGFGCVGCSLVVHGSAWSGVSEVVGVEVAASGCVGYGDGSRIQGFRKRRFVDGWC